MNNWIEAKVKYVKQLEDGRLKRVTERYLFDAVSFTDAEARAYELIGERVQGEFLVTHVTKKNFEDIFAYEDSEDWYKCKVVYQSIDNDEGKEKTIKVNMLVTAKDVKQAFERIKESLSDMNIGFEVPKIELTSIVEVIPYETEEA